MSILRLINNTSADAPIPELSFTFPKGIPIDLMDSDSYTIGQSPAVQYSLGYSFSDFVSIKNGIYYKLLSDLIRTGNWKLNNGDKDYYYEQALHLLKYGEYKDEMDLPLDTKIVSSHDYCNRVSWYEDSVRRIDVPLDSMSTKVYSLPSQYKNGIVDLMSGYVNNDEAVLASNTYNVSKEVLKEGSTIITDYSVDYRNGIITVGDTYTPISTLTLSFNDPIKSSWDLHTDPLYETRVIKVEAQFSSNIDISHPMYFNVDIDHPVAGPMTVDSIVYKSIRDFLSICNSGSTISSFGGTSNKVGIMGDIVVLPFNYTKPLVLPTGVNARISVYTKGHVELKGDYATVTFYTVKIKL